MRKRVVLITGCSSGIGAAAALSFARAGDAVISTMRNVSAGADLREVAAEEGLDLRLAPLDVADGRSIADAVDSVHAAFGRIDVLVNNAGVLPVGAFETISERRLRETMEVNFFGPLALARAVLPGMRARRSGILLFVSSLSGLAATAGDSVYAASKFALEGFVEGLRDEVARFNIRTALIEPGRCDTRLFKSMGTPMDAGESAKEYEPLNTWLRQQAAAPAHGALAPADVAEILVSIANNGAPNRLRWPAGDTAARVFGTMFAQTDAERNAFLREVSAVDWWVRGEDPED